MKQKKCLLTSQLSRFVRDIIQEGMSVELNLTCNKLGDSGAHEISKAIEGNSTLKKLFLTHNAIGTSGVLALATALCRNNTSELLYIDFNGILDAGVTEIAECLKMNETLKILNVSKNNITEVGAKVLAEIFNYNSVLDDLTVDLKWVPVIKQHSKQSFSCSIPSSHTALSGLFHFPAMSCYGPDQLLSRKR